MWCFALSHNVRMELRDGKRISCFPPSLCVHERSDGKSSVLASIQAIVATCRHNRFSGLKITEFGQSLAARGSHTDQKRFWTESNEVNDLSFAESCLPEYIDNIGGNSSEGSCVHLFE